MTVFKDYCHLGKKHVVHHYILLWSNKPFWFLLFIYYTLCNYLYYAILYIVVYYVECCQSLFCSSWHYWQELFITWVLDVETHLKSNGLSEVIKANNSAYSQDKSKALFFIRRHLHGVIRFSTTWEVGVEGA